VQLSALWSRSKKNRADAWTKDNVEMIDYIEPTEEEKTIARLVRENDMLRKRLEQQETKTVVCSVLFFLFGITAGIVWL
jgi:peroxiredoxin family protein